MPFLTAERSSYRSARDKFSIPSINPYLFAGFTEGEGCFLVNIKSSKITQLKKAVQLIFKLGQHKRDEQLMIKLIEFLGYGNVYKGNEVGINLIVTKFIDLAKVLSFFLKSILYKKAKYLAAAALALSFGGRRVILLQYIYNILRDRQDKGKGKGKGQRERSEK